jgi:CheY-like chemotaxis protein/anti-sigma regulatory factor (Ser/Thr protein kinase)
MRMYVEQIQDGLTQVSSVVEGLIDLTRANTSSALRTEPAEVKQLIERSLVRYRELISSQNIKVETGYGEDIPTIRNADVEHVFANIVKNAIQAMPDGGTLSIKAHMLSPRLLEVSFSDTGPGISDELRESIFEPFYTTKDSGQGIGLGLFISQEIVESYSGTIEVRSEQRQGTTFVVRLPMYRGKVLFMDDEKHIRDLASGMLSSMGYKVVTTIDGSETIELYKDARDSDTPYDVVILDLTVPDGMDGKDTIQRLLKIDPAVKAIVSSGYFDDPILASFREYGFRGALSKPYRVEDMDKILDAVIAGVS